MLDVRDRRVSRATSQGAHPLRELSKRLTEIGAWEDKPVIVTCKSGTSAGAASRFLKQAGFTAVYQLKGGVAAWQQASLPVEK